MRAILCVVVIFFASACLILAQPEQENKAIEVLADLYRDCDKRNKRCFGDNDICLGYKNCTFAISIEENRTDFKIITMNACYNRNEQEASRDFFVGVGLSTVDNRGEQNCREPTFDDFKAFIFWNQRKCRQRMYGFEVSMGSRNKLNWQTNCLYNKTLHGADPRQERFMLSDYLRRYILVGTSAGDKYPFKFADRVDYTVKGGGLLYINRVQPPYEPPEHNFEVRRPPSDASSQSGDKNDGGDDDNGANTISASMALFFLMTLQMLLR